MPGDKYICFYDKDGPEVAFVISRLVGDGKLSYHHRLYFLLTGGPGKQSAMGRATTNGIAENWNLQRKGVSHPCAAKLFRVSCITLQKIFSINFFY